MHQAQFTLGSDPGAAVSGFFRFSVQPSERVSWWACMGCTQETPDCVHPAALRPELSWGIGPTFAV